MTDSRPHALVFAPVLPQWDEGRFFATVTGALEAFGCRVTVVDTLALLEDSMTEVSQLARSWLPRMSEVDLLVGNALGGAVAQALLPDLRPPATVLVSAPTRADRVLAERLSTVADLAAEGDLSRSLAVLGELVTAEGVEPPVHQPVPADEQACRRIAGGMRLLLEVDLTEQVLSYEGPLMHLVGERSRLVTTAHLAAAAHHEVVEVPGAGMRPHSDRPEFVTDHLTRFAKENLTP
ncbi:hypothetical protein GCM10010174_24870 [Kutzneria viridogrisea]|uniref:Pimeloyl-ACP methyl ester carboxylesterase n=1 Tax=Kutzneria viridogrisea TaxID=47990 RepID=A0ABR6BPX2_9PSEU|nr:pimeloyl-ACP methyl ester carboxylesterase [Kutzneria viridogrisea]